MGAGGGEKITMSKTVNYNPRILGFLCNWCCYGGADLCGVSRFQYPPYLRVIRVMCSGRVDPSFILKAFSKGTDGVFIGGCHINDCHYNTEGNYDAFAMAAVFKKLLSYIGISPERLRLEWVSAGEGIRFAEIMNAYGNKIKSMGPLGTDEISKGKDLTRKIDSVAQMIPYIKLVLRQSMTPSVRTEQGYHDYYSSEEFDNLYRKQIEEKLYLKDISSLLSDRPLASKDIAKATGMSPSEVSRYMAVSSRHGIVNYSTRDRVYSLTS